MRENGNSLEMSYIILENEGLLTNILRGYSLRQECIQEC